MREKKVTDTDDEYGKQPHGEAQADEFRQVTEVKQTKLADGFRQVSEPKQPELIWMFRQASALLTRPELMPFANCRI